MAVSKNFANRRLQVVSAAETAVAKHGLQGVTLDAVAKEAGMSANALLYYYSGLKDVLNDVQAQAVERFCVHRASTVAEIADPRERLKVMIRSGLPAGQDDQLCRLLHELGGFARTDAAYAARHIILFERQVAIYIGILEAGAAMGHFKLPFGSDVVARGLVTLEDGLGLHLVNIVQAIDQATALRILFNYAEMATGCSLAPDTAK